jgi:hypothetical protein
MTYDTTSFHPTRIVAALDFLLPDASVHGRIGRSGWMACSLSTARTMFQNSATARLLRDQAPDHDWLTPSNPHTVIPLGYVPAAHIFTSWRPFLTRHTPHADWVCLNAFEPLGFVWYGRHRTSDCELLLQDARDGLAIAAMQTTFVLNAPAVAAWMAQLHRLPQVSTPTSR